MPLCERSSCGFHLKILFRSAGKPAQEFILIEAEGHRGDRSAERSTELTPKSHYEALVAPTFMLCVM
jgi:hypothetical protein